MLTLLDAPKGASFFPGCQQNRNVMSTAGMMVPPPAEGSQLAEPMPPERSPEAEPEPETGSGIVSSTTTGCETDEQTEQQSVAVYFQAGRSKLS